MAWFLPALGTVGRFAMSAAILPAYNFGKKYMFTSQGRAEAGQAIKSGFNTIAKGFTKRGTGANLGKRQFSFTRTALTGTGASMAYGAANKIAPETTEFLTNAGLGAVETTAGVAFDLAVEGTTAFGSNIAERYGLTNEDWYDPDKLVPGADDATILDTDEYQAKWNALSEEEQAQYYNPEIYEEEIRPILLEEHNKYLQEQLQQQQTPGAAAPAAAGAAAAGVGAAGVSEDNRTLSTLDRLKQTNVNSLDGPELSSAFQSVTQTVDNMGMDLGWQFKLYATLGSVLSGLDSLLGTEFAERFQRNALDIVKDNVTNQGNMNWISGITDGQDFTPEGQPAPRQQQPAPGMS